jgi:hypothetical protein
MITTKIWGPYAWKYFHFVALAYPINPTNEDKQNYYNFYIYFGKVLPCENCIHHYDEHLKNFPLTKYILSTKDTLLKWTIDIHNQVNIKGNKKIYNYDSAIALIKNNFNEIDKPIIESFNNSNNYLNKKKNNNMLYFLIILVLVLILIAVLYKKY